MKMLVAALVAVSAFASVAEAQVRVRGYTRSDGTYVAPHTRSRPDSSTSNNYSTPGNYNPNSGRVTPLPSYGYTPPPTYTPAPAYTPPTAASRPVAQPGTSWCTSYTPC